jgi:hypothetical protein
VIRGTATLGCALEAFFFDFLQHHKKQNRRAQARLPVPQIQRREHSQESLCLECPEFVRQIVGKQANRLCSCL